MKHKFLELLASMRFAVSLLSILAIASVIGTVLPQEQATINYINQFGPFWAKLFSQLGLNRIYSAIWFLLILFFLVCSTSLCIIRNAPRMIADMRSWRDHIRKKALFNFHHKAIWTSPLSSASLLNQLTDALKRQGYQVKSTHRTEAILISAKKGRFNKLGYLAAHGAIVMICLGGLLDSDLFIRTQEWWFKKVPFNGELILGKVPTQHLLGIYNPSFRGNMLVAEGASSHFAIINRDQGVLLQELPFSIHLKKFIIEHYSTGVPKLFASEVEITDRETQKKFSNVIKVNHPLIYKGMAVYQSSFEDGGSALELTGYNMRGNQDSVFKVTGIVGEKTSLEQVQAGKEKFMLEWSGFRPFNIEDLNNIT